MKLYTEAKFANNTMILPIVGQVTLDQDASFECDDSKALLVIDMLKTSQVFDTKLVIKKPKVEVPGKQDEPKQVDKPKSAKELLDAVVEAVGITQVMTWLTPYLPKQESLVQEQSGSKKENKKKESKKNEKDEDKFDKDLADSLIDDLKEADKESMLQLVDVIPNVDLDEVSKLDETSLRQLLIDKINAAKDK